MEDITEAADVGKGTLVNYSESKDHVLGVMAEIQLRKVTEAVTLSESDNQTIYSVHRLFLRVTEEPGRSPDLPRALISSFLASERPLEEALSSNTARAALIIPQHFGRDISRGTNSSVQLLVDASDANTAKLVAAYATQITRAYDQQIAGTQNSAPVQTAIRHAPRESYSPIGRQLM